VSKPGFLYGYHPVLEALRSRPDEVQRLYVASGARQNRLRDVFSLAERQGIAVVELAGHAMDDLVGRVAHQGVAAEVKAFAYVELEAMLTLASERGEAPLLVALDQIQDPGNLGAIIRSAFALGAHGLFFPTSRAAEVTPTVVKASAGASNHLLIGRVVNLSRAINELKDAGVWSVGAVMGEGEPIERVDWTMPTLLVVGSEGHGLRRLVGETCDRLAHIPMPGGLGSLNASVAAAICLYEANRQRRGSSS